MTRAPSFVGRRTDACEPPGAAVQVPWCPLSRQKPGSQPPESSRRRIVFSTEGDQRATRVIRRRTSMTTSKPETLCRQQSGGAPQWSTSPAAAARSKTAQCPPRVTQHVVATHSSERKFGRGQRAFSLFDTGQRRRCASQSIGGRSRSDRTVKPIGCRPSTMRSMISGASNELVSTRET